MFIRLRLGLNALLHSEEIVEIIRKTTEAALRVLDPTATVDVEDFGE